MSPLLCASWRLAGDLLEAHWRRTCGVLEPARLSLGGNILVFFEVFGKNAAILFLRGLRAVVVLVKHC